MKVQERRRRDRGPKGRPLDDSALAEVRALLGDRPRRRDLLIEFLHLIQDEYRCLSARHLRALAEEMRLAQAEVYEVASFYDHFDVVKEGEPAPAPLTIRVCDSISCMLAGAEKLLAELVRQRRSRRHPRRARALRRPLRRRAGRPDRRPRSRQRHERRACWRWRAPATPRSSCRTTRRSNAYRAVGGYQLLRKVRDGTITAEALIATLQDAGLRGLGGAGFPTGKKWEIVRTYPGPRLMSINGDEGEPGTFKDRIYLERDPHRSFEGALIAAHAVEAERIYFYMRDEYPAVLAILRREIAALEAAGITKPGFIELRRGAGAYICGEESAMLESIEGKRGLPRHRPPYIAEVGPVWPPDAQSQRRDPVVDPRHRREGREMVRRARASPAIPACGRGRCRAGSRTPA